MLSKALRGYEQVFGPDHAKSETLRDQLCALDAVVANKAPVEIEERADDLPIVASWYQKASLNIKTAQAVSKAYLKVPSLTYGSIANISCRIILSSYVYT
jgi:hypothetical protein